jgi:hypothetical protein
MVDLTIMSIKTVDPRIKKFKNIITVNPYNHEYYQYKDQQFTPIENLGFNNSNFVISYISNKDMIIASFDLGYSVDPAEIDDVIYMKAYDELGLDPEKEYDIHHQKVDTNEQSHVYNLFIIEPEVIQERNSKIIETTKYIDLSIPAPLLFGTLYKGEILERNEAHCFIYFTMEDTFVSIYNEGRFLYSKSLEFSLEQIYEKYCAMIGEKVDKKEFFETLESEGLKATDSFFQQNLMKLFSEIFLQINDIIIYIKRAYNLPSMGKLFLGSVQSPIIGLGDYGYNYLGIPTFNLDFNFGIKSDEWYIDQLQYMMVQSGLGYLENPDTFINLTNKPRPPVFSKRASGQFIIATAVSSLLALAWPLSYLALAYSNDASSLLLSKEEQELSAISKKYKKILEEKQALIQKHKKELKKLENIFEGKAKTLVSIHNRKVNYKFKSKFLYDFAKDLTKYNVKVEAIKSHEDSYSLHMISSDEKSLTKYIKYISEKYFSTIQKINIKRIKFNERDTKYRGILEVSYK